MAEEVSYNDGEKQKAHEAVDLKAMEREVELTSAAAEKLNSPVVWTHHDLLSGNILVSHQASDFSVTPWWHDLKILLAAQRQASAYHVTYVQA